MARQPIAIIRDGKVCIRQTEPIHAPQGGNKFTQEIDMSPKQAMRLIQQLAQCVERTLD